MAIIPSPELDCISRRLAAEQGVGESARRQLLRSYLDFLGRAAGSKEPLFPSRSVDEIWHRHILDTRSYARDCARWFGTFIHHQPDSTPESVGTAGARADCRGPERPCRPNVGALADCCAQNPKPVPARRVLAGALANCSAQDPAPCSGIASPPAQ